MCSSDLRAHNPEVGGSNPPSATMKFKPIIVEIITIVGFCFFAVTLDTLHRYEQKHTLINRCSMCASDSRALNPLQEEEAGSDYYGIPLLP